MDFDKLTIRLRQFGGLRLVREYTKLGVLWTGVVAFFRCLVKRESFKAIYPEILKKVEPYLELQYYHCIQDRKEYYKRQVLEHERSKFVWFCWLQGLEQAPELVNVCYNSLKRHLIDREIIVIDANNWKKFVELPEYVERKWDKGRIMAANFSDLLRLQLLIKYGGTWIDSTVLCMGGSALMVQGSRILDTDLFMFQYTPEGTTKGISISNWFITACTNNEVLMVLRDMPYAYWKDYDCTLDYYMFHLFFEMVAREYPEKVRAMPYGSSQRSIALMRHWKETFNQEQWDKLVSKVAFHKLSYRVSESVKSKKDNYFNHIIKRLS